MKNSVIRKIKIVIGDCSCFSRLVLADILNAEPDLEVLDTAENGEELIKKIRTLKPDLVIADYQLPKNNRMYTFRLIQQEFNIPILMLLGKENISDSYIFEAMKVGVYDLVRITSQSQFPQFRKIQQELVLKVRGLKDIRQQQQEVIPSWIKIKPPTPYDYLQNVSATTKKPRSYVVIGASTGGTKAIETIIRELKPILNAAVLIAVHLPENFTKTFAQRLKSLTSLKVVEGRSGTRLEAGKIVVAPGDKNMIVNSHMGVITDLRIGFSEAPANEFDCPSVDILMKSVAKLAGPHTLGIILTGMGKDGTNGSKAILHKGGETIAQDEATSAIFGMPKSAIEKGYITKVMSLSQIPGYINRFDDYHRI